ncbi:hypothetical protein M3Y99_01426100 [Aphelenchoides fujianensis]|nr:hypothetical protein M3Y99_01426100 [Aphelenchoides fujianensis]
MSSKEQTSSSSTTDGSTSQRVFAKEATKEWDLEDTKQRELYEFYRPERVPPNKRGYDLLKAPEFNKGMGFSLYERQALGIHGLLPPAFMTEQQQAYRVMSKLREQPNDLARYVQLSSLQDRNEKLFYRVIVENIKECLPLVYTPTVGLACQQFGAIYRNPKGLYVTINDNSISQIYQILSNWPHSDVRAIVVTDGERILGLGDLGAYGMGIPVGKLALYVALGGVQPRWCLPVLLDVGTDNEKLLEDPFYIGLRRKRVRGEEYDRFVDNFMKACVKKFGQNTLIQFEDFANRNAYRLLDRYQSRYAMFNDDIQGTAAVVVAGLMGASKASKQKLSEMTYVFLGAGSAGIGIAEMLVKQMETEGLKTEDAYGKIFIMDSKGVVTTSRKEQKQGHAPFAKDMKEMKDLAEIVRELKPHALIGTCTVGGAFSEDVVKAMAEVHEQPIVFALSNPTDKAECTAEQAYKWTNGKVLYASGSPMDNVELNGRTYCPGQGNNAYVFPGVALGIILFQIKHVDSRHFLIAAKVVADFVQEKDMKHGRIYPRIQEIRELSVQIAKRLAEECYKEGTAGLRPEPEHKELFIRSQIFNVEYDEIVSRPYEWPEADMRHGFPTPMEHKSLDDEEED